MFKSDPKPVKKEKAPPKGNWVGGRLIATISNMSKKRSQGERLFQSNRKEYLIEHPFCLVKVRCSGGKATTVHHKKGKIGQSLWLKKYFLGCCWPCHDYIEDHPEWSYEKGFSLPRIE